MKKETINIRMTWAHAAKIIAAVIEVGATPEGKQLAIETLMDMAKVADAKLDSPLFAVNQVVNFVDEVIQNHVGDPINFGGEKAKRLRELIKTAKGEK